MQIEEVIQQKQFTSESQKMGINLLYTASWFSTELTRVLKPFGISWQQFNIMRILRGQKGCPAPLKLVSERMIDRMSNTSRLVDKLVAKGFVVRKTAKEDRRQVALTLTDGGFECLDQASKAVDEMSIALFGGIENEKLEELNDLLNEIRKTN